MNKTVGLQLVAYSLLLAGLSYLAHYLAPTLARTTLLPGLAGGALCLVWGIRAMTGSRGKALPILTLVPVSYLMLSQTILAWLGGSEAEEGRRAAATVITLLLALSFAMLMRVAYAGVVLDGQPASPTKDGGVKSQTTGKPAGHANATKHP